MRLMTVIAMLAVVTNLAGCDGGAGGPADDPASPTDSTTGSGTDLTTTQTREQVRTTTEDVFALLIAENGPLEPAQPSVLFVNGSWSGCDDDLATWAYEGSGRVDLRAGATAVDQLADIRAAVENDGWVYDPNPVAADPATSVTARKGPHLLRIQAYPDQPFVLVSVSGPCIEPTGAERDDLEAHRRTEPITLP